MNAARPILSWLLIPAILMDIAFRDIRIDTKTGPALLCENIAGLEIEGLRTPTPHPDCATIDLKDVSDAYIHGCRATTGTEVFVGLRGEKCRDILMQGNDLRSASTPVKTTEGCPASALIRD